MGSQSRLLSKLTSENDIREFLSIAFQINLDKDAFLRPTREMMERIYKSFIVDLTNKNVDQPNLQAAAGMDHIELYMGIIPVINLTAEIRLVLRKWDNLLFHISDILEPRRKRTQHFLTVLTTLWAYINDDIYPRWLQLSTEKKELQLKERSAKCDQALSGARRTIEKLALKISNMENTPGFKDKDRRLAEIKELADRKREEKEELRRLVAETKLAVAKNDEKKSEIKLETNILKEKRCAMEKKLAEIRQVYDNVDELTERYQNQMEIKRKLEKDSDEMQNQLAVSKEFNKLSLSVAEEISTLCKKLSSHKKLSQEASKIECDKANYLNKEKELNIKEMHLKEYIEKLKMEIRNKEELIATKLSEYKESIKFTEALLKEKEASVELMRAKYREKLLYFKNQRQDLTNKKEKCIADSDSFKSKVEAALEGFDKNMQESFQIISRPLIKS